MSRPATNLEEAAAEKEHKARVIRMAELSIDRQPQRVPVESSASLRLRRTQRMRLPSTSTPFIIPRFPTSQRHSLLIAEVAPGTTRRVRFCRGASDPNVAAPPSNGRWD